MSFPNGVNANFAILKCLLGGQGRKIFGISFANRIFRNRFLTLK